jgi:hypothetical protein
MTPADSMDPRYVCNFYFVKTHKITTDATTTEAREKISTDLDSLKIRFF